MKSVPWGWPAIFVLLVLSATIGWMVAFDDHLTETQIDRADSTVDLLVAKAFVDGVDPYQDLYALADQYGIVYENPVERGEAAIAAPRTPGAILLLAPLAPFDSKGALVAVLAVSVVGVAVVACILITGLRISYAAVAAVVSYGLLLGPAQWSFFYGAQSHLLMLLMAVFVVALVRDHELIAGACLAVVATMKLFPLLVLFVLLVHKRYRAVLSCVLLMAAFNLLPLLLPHVTFAGAWDALTNAQGNWSDIVNNIGLGATLQRLYGISEVAALVVQLGLVSWVLMSIWRRKLGLEIGLALGITVGLLVSPLSWPHYLLVAVPLVVLAYRLHPVGWARFALPVGLLLTMPIAQTELDTLGLIVMAASFAYGDFEAATDGWESPARLDSRSFVTTHLPQEG